MRAGAGGETDWVAQRASAYKAVGVIFDELVVGRDSVRPLHARWNFRLAFRTAVGPYMGPYGRPHLSSISRLYAFGLQGLRRNAARSPAPNCVCLHLPLEDREVETGLPGHLQIGGRPSTSGTHATNILISSTQSTYSATHREKGG